MSARRLCVPALSTTRPGRPRLSQPGPRRRRGGAACNISVSQPVRPARRRRSLTPQTGVSCRNGRARTRRPAGGPFDVADDRTRLGPAPRPLRRPGQPAGRRSRGHGTDGEPADGARVGDDAANWVTNVKKTALKSWLYVLSVAVSVAGRGGTTGRSGPAWRRAVSCRRPSRAASSLCVHRRRPCQMRRECRRRRQMRKRRLWGAVPVRRGRHGDILAGLRLVCSRESPAPVARPAPKHPRQDAATGTGRQRLLCCCRVANVYAAQTAPACVLCY